MTVYDRFAVTGYPAERLLASNEWELAVQIREHIPRRDRLRVCQLICELPEEEKDKWGFFSINPDTRFPRYRFFNVAMPDADWGRFAKGTER